MLSSDSLTPWLGRLNDFVMSTWTNDIAVGINQDALGVAGRRIDNSSALGAGTILSAEFEPLKLGSSANVALMAVAVRIRCTPICSLLSCADRCSVLCGFLRRNVAENQRIRSGSSTPGQAPSPTLRPAPA